MHSELFYLVDISNPLIVRIHVTQDDTFLVLLDIFC